MARQTRRDFMKASLAASAGLGAMWSGQASAAGKPGDKMKFGLVTYLWGQDWDLPTLIANCEKCGYGALELRVQHAHKVEPSLNAQQRREVKKRFADSPVIYLGPGTNQQYDHPDPYRLAEAVEGTRQYIRLSHDCGGTGVKVKPNSFHKEVEQARTIEQIGRTLNIVGAIAGDYGQLIRVEVHGDCAPLPIMHKIFEYVESPHVKMCWNCNGQDTDGRGIEYNFNLVKDDFGDTVHVRELNIGDYPYQELMDMFVAMDYRGWILLEARTKPEDRIAALIEQRRIFEEMVAKGQAKL